MYFRYATTTLIAIIDRHYFHLEGKDNEVCVSEDLKNPLSPIRSNRSFWGRKEETETERNYYKRLNGDVGEERSKEGLCRSNFFANSLQREWTTW